MASPADKEMPAASATSAQMAAKKDAIPLLPAKAKEFIIDCNLPVEDQLFNLIDFEKFLIKKIKIQGKTGALGLGSNILIEREDKSLKLTINNNTPFTKRYLKYLTKKYLKKMRLRHTLLVISTGRDTYELRYFEIKKTC